MRLLSTHVFTSDHDMPVGELLIDTGVFIQQTFSPPWWAVSYHLPVVTFQLMITRSFLSLRYFFQYTHYSNRTLCGKSHGIVCLALKSSQIKIMYSCIKLIIFYCSETRYLTNAKLSILVMLQVQNTVLNFLTAAHQSNSAADKIKQCYVIVFIYYYTKTANNRSRQDTSLAMFDRRGDCSAHMDQMMKY